MSSGRAFLCPLTCVPEDPAAQFISPLEQAAFTPDHAWRAASQETEPLLSPFQGNLPRATAHEPGAESTVFARGKPSWGKTLARRLGKWRFLRFTGLETSKKSGTIPQKHRTARRKRCCRQDKTSLHIAAVALCACWGQTGLLTLKIKLKHSSRKLQGSEH